MEGIPVAVKNVTIYQYFNPDEPISEVILSGGSGTYSVGTLGLYSFYNLNLDDVGEEINPLNIHGRYYATFEVEAGHMSTTPWMFCLDNSEQPQFGRTMRMLAADSSDLGVHAANSSDFIQIAALTDITVTQSSSPTSIAISTLITNGRGSIISTKTGTPHEMGVQVNRGDRLGAIIVGSGNIMISGKTKDGYTYSQTGYTAISGGEPAIFLKLFPR